MRARAQQGGIKDDGRDEITLKIGIVCAERYACYSAAWARDCRGDCRFEPPVRRMMLMTTMKISLSLIKISARR